MPGAAQDGLADKEREAERHGDAGQDEHDREPRVGGRVVSQRVGLTGWAHGAAATARC